MIRHILQLIWSGLWIGFGAEISFFVLWATWHLLHRKIAHKLNESSFFHRIHSYFE